ncbi:hypothetical protein BJ742DRAFT_774525 [Cladochytrium replicatum]|nr:hypothetical protein BJ742DRAFT_774525 [Cladochytrium replicatum]
MKDSRRRCCCCIPLRIGTLILSVILLALNVLSGISAIFPFSKIGEQTVWPSWSAYVNAGLALVAAATIIFGIVAISMTKLVLVNSFLRAYKGIIFLIFARDLAFTIVACVNYNRVRTTCQSYTRAAVLNIGTEDCGPVATFALIVFILAMMIEFSLQIYLQDLTQQYVTSIAHNPTHYLRNQVYPGANEARPMVQTKSEQRYDRRVSRDNLIPTHRPSEDARY